MPDIRQQHAQHSHDLAQHAEGTPAPLWIHILPPEGLTVGEDGRQFVAHDLQEIIDASKSAHDLIPVDIDHNIEQHGGPAAGWVTGYEIRDTGLWGEVDWTPNGKALVESRDYRYLSPSIWVDQETDQVMSVTSVSLTNRPNLTQLTALNTSEQLAPEDSTMTLDDLLARMRDTLSLDSQADADAIVQATVAARDRSAVKPDQPSLDRFVPRADFDALQLELSAIKDNAAQAHAQLIDQEVKQAVDAGKVAPATVEYHTAQCKTEGGLERFRSFVEVSRSQFARPEIKSQDHNSQSCIRPSLQEMAEKTGVDQELIAKELQRTREG